MYEKSAAMSKKESSRAICATRVEMCALQYRVRLDGEVEVFKIYLIRTYTCTHTDI